MTTTDIATEISYQLRAETEADMNFLYDVYASTREEEMQVVPWTQEQKKEFLQMQFRAQSLHYHKYFGNSSFDIICINDTRIGRLYVERDHAEIRIVDIALLPEFRNRGVGTSILEKLKTEADQKGISLVIHVERNNPAISLYKRLGFISIEDKGLYHLMEHKSDHGSRQRSA